MIPMRRGWLAALTFGVVMTAGFDIAPAGGGDKQRWKKCIPDDVFKTLVEREARLIQENLKGDPEKDQLARAQVGAVLIMAFAASHEKPNAAIEARGAIAQEIARSIRARGKLDHARTLADDLVKGKVDGKVEAGKRDFRGDLTLGELMNPLHIVKKGGDPLPKELQVSIRLKEAGVEEEIRFLAMKELSKANMEKASKELAILGYRLAALGEIIPEFPLPKKGKGKGTAKEWRELSADMRDAALELAAAAQKKDTEAVNKSGARLNAVCSQCHSAFK